jgi:hypothetical protein
LFRSRSHTRWALPLTLGLTALGLAVPAASAAPPKSAPVRDDFNGDGYADLAIGAPNGTVGGQSRAGYVTVLYGGPPVRPRRLAPRVASRQEHTSELLGDC